MAVKYKVVTKKPGGAAGNHPVKYYPILTDRQGMNLRQLSDLISVRTTLTRGDVMAVIETLIESIPDLLMDGYNVKLGDFGTFSLHASAKGQDDPDKVRGRDITSVKMSFLPSKYVKGRLKHTEFVKKPSR